MSISWNLSSSPVQKLDALLRMFQDCCLYMSFPLTATDKRIIVFIEEVIKDYCPMEHLFKLTPDNTYLRCLLEWVAKDELEKAEGAFFLILKGARGYRIEDAEEILWRDYRYPALGIGLHNDPSLPENYHL